MRSSTIAEMNLSEPRTRNLEAKLLDSRDMALPGLCLEPKISTVLERNPESWVEPLDQFPQNIFLIRLGGRTIVGRKLMSKRHVAGEILELHCSLINASHVLGEFDGLRQSENDITINYFPYCESERRWVIETVADTPMAEIIFPFVYLLDGRERTSPSQGWSLDPERADNLGHGESNLRAFSCDILSEFGNEIHTLYDPACSTGQFLAELKALFPQATTVGQDLSAEMIAHAQNFLDYAYQGDAANPAIPNGTASAVFCRFLNSEVVSTESARKLLNRLRLVVEKNGIFVVFGHTPVLVRASEIVKDKNFRMIRCNGFDSDRTSVFQYYVARRVM